MTQQGLTSDEAAALLAEVGPNELQHRQVATRRHVLWRQVRNPLVLLLVFAATISLITAEWTDAGIVVAIIVASIGLGYTRELRAETAIGLLLKRIEIAAVVKRDGAWGTRPVREVVPGDLVRISAGSLVPADAVLVEANELYASEAALTGESFAVAKRVAESPPGAPLRERIGEVFLGTNIRSGTGVALVSHTGPRTAFGAVAGRLATRPPEPEFERGLRRFGLGLLVSMLVMVIIVLTVNVILGRPMVETLLFAIALAVGLSPELLPAVISVNLAHAATQLADVRVLCRRLDAIENLGSMTVLCTDKTGTLTNGVASVENSYDPAGTASPAVMELAAINAALQTGLANPIDEAILVAHPLDVSRLRKLGEVPYDFVRKCLSVMVERDGKPLLILKGAFDHVLDACSVDEAGQSALRGRYDAWCADGIRVIAVATRELPPGRPYDRSDEQGLTFAGFITFVDPPKADAARVIADLRALGVAVKMVTGDSMLVARHVALAVGLDAEHIMTGKDVDQRHDTALAHAVATTTLFAEVDPTQKERVLKALRRSGEVVGFFGDGINDAPALHAADVGISVDSAVDVAKASADLVLLDKDLDVIRRGIQLGRTTFANTLKYVLTTTSANLGNMVSMAVASLALPFLPLTAGQILLNNFLSDVPAIGMATDRVDPELVARPRRWNMRMIGGFMLSFGLLSSLFDGLTFLVLRRGFSAGPELFRTTWFVESLLTELAVALVVRTRRPSWRSRPGRVLVITTLVIAVLGFAIPYLPYVSRLGFVPLPLSMVATVVGIALAYVLATEVLKVKFYRWRVAAAA